MLRIGIIGTAGRGDDNPKMTKDLYFRMLRRTELKCLNELLDADLNKNDLTLVSGGAAWSDHLAVSLWKRYQGVMSLELHLPAKWNMVQKCFSEDSGKFDPGRIANFYHEKFSTKMGRSSLESLFEVCAGGDPGVEVQYHKGFHARNLHVGQVDVLLAFTWNPGDSPKVGSGTAHTWDNSPARKKLHVDLNTLV